MRKNSSSSKRYADTCTTKRLTALSLGLLGMTLFVSSARTQSTGGFAVAPAGRAAGRPSPQNAAPIGAALPRGGPARGHVLRAHHSRHIFAGSAFGLNYYPYYDYAAYDSEDGRDPREGSLEAPPARIIVQTAAPASSAVAPKPPESLVMELRGDHWVRLTSSSTEFYEKSVNPPPALPPAILVFPDGHQEEAAKYTIVGKTISIKSDYWTSGSWTRTVPIADLDLPATLRANQARGANFRLPSRPGEVIMRP
jgi:hypothetical protein